VGNVKRIMIIAVALLVVFFCLRLPTFGQVCDCRCGDCVFGGDNDVADVYDIVPEYSTQFGFRNASGIRTYRMRTDGAGDNSFNFSDTIGRIIQIAAPGENVTFLRTIDGVQLMVNGTSVLTSVTDIWVDEAGDVMTGVLLSSSDIQTNASVNATVFYDDGTEISTLFVNVSGDTMTGVLQSNGDIKTDGDVNATSIRIGDTAYWGSSFIDRIGSDLRLYMGTGRDNQLVPYFDNEYSLGNSSHRWRDFYTYNATIEGELNVSGIRGDGSGKVVCVKADGNLGTCSDAPDGSGVCTCG